MLRRTDDRNGSFVKHIPLPTSCWRESPIRIYTLQITTADGSFVIYDSYSLSCLGHRPSSKLQHEQLQWTAKSIIFLQLAYEITLLHAYYRLQTLGCRALHQTFKLDVVVALSKFVTSRHIDEVTLRWAWLVLRWYHLWVDAPHQYVTNQLGQLSFSFSRVDKSNISLNGMWVPVAIHTLLLPFTLQFMAY